MALLHLSFRLRKIYVNYIISPSAYLFIFNTSLVSHSVNFPSISLPIQLFIYQLKLIPSFLRQSRPTYFFI